MISYGFTLDRGLAAEHEALSVRLPSPCEHSEMRPRLDPFHYY